MKVITVGRDSNGNDVVINDPTVSRHHFQIVQNDDGSFCLADFGSTNGTYINGRKVSGEVDLNEDDVVRVGNTTIPWKQYFTEDAIDSSPQVDKPKPVVAVQTGSSEGDGEGGLVWRVIGIVVSLVMIIGGLSGTLVLKGTDSGIALAVVGGLILIFNIIMLALASKKSN